MEVLSISVSNIHCNDCENTIIKTLDRIFKALRVDKNPSNAELMSSENIALVYIYNNSIDIFYNAIRSESSFLVLFIKKIMKNLTRAGFNITSWEFFSNGSLLYSSTTDTFGEEGNWYHGRNPILMMVDSWRKYRERRQRNRHIKRCHMCRDSRKESQDSEATLAEEHANDKSATNKYKAVFAVQGMTCSSCSQSVSESIKAVLKTVYSDSDNEENLNNNSVNLIEHSATVVLPNKQSANDIVESVNNSGFECSVIELLPLESKIRTKVLAKIGGMTCATCSSSIQASVNALPFVVDSSINLMTSLGQFIITDDSSREKEHLGRLTDTIKDCGFDVQVFSAEKVNYSLGKVQSRGIEISIANLACENCPRMIASYLDSYGSSIEVDKYASLESPTIKISYLPSSGNTSVRRFLFDLNHIHASDQDPFFQIKPNDPGLFACELNEPLSLEEQLRTTSKREILNISIRLVFATIFAIPTFIFGIVAMSLLPSENSFRIWVEEPMWAGNTSRNTWILLILSTPVYLFAADVFHRKAFKEVYSLWVHKNSWKRRFMKFGSMNLLVCLGTSVSYFASIALLILECKQDPSQKGFKTTYFDSVVFLTFFLLIGKVLEGISKSKSADSVASLNDFKVSRTTLIESHETDMENTIEYTVDPKYLEFGDHIRITPGDSLPRDCVITEGCSQFDESSLTGESTPVVRLFGQQIYSGTVNCGNTSVIGKIISFEGDSMIDQIINTVRDGQLRKAPIERKAEELTGYFVPCIVSLAILTWIIWLCLAYSDRLPATYLDNDIGGWSVWSLQFAIAVFVIACPCGIGLAAPTALFIGSGLAAKNGILAKGGGIAFQDMAHTRVFCFDKTGTLTHGILSVTDYYFEYWKANSEEEKKALSEISLQCTRTMELASKHPLAKCIINFIEEISPRYNIEVDSSRVSDVENVPGKGLKGRCFSQSLTDGIWKSYLPSELLLGNDALMRDHDVSISPKNEELLIRWRQEGKSVVIFAAKNFSFFGDTDFHLILLIACRDRIRTDARCLIGNLQKKDTECWMVTGDNRVTAEAIALEMNITPERVISDVLPDKKEQSIASIRNRTGKVVAMVGDGVNDAPALAGAHVGIALSSGADLAVTSSDFIVLNQRHPFHTISVLCDLSNKVFARVKFNFGWSIVFNVIGIPIAAGVIYPYNNSRLSPVWASAAMALSSVSVVLSSLALKLYKPDKMEEEYHEDVALQIPKES